MKRKLLIVLILLSFAFIASAQYELYRCTAASIKWEKSNGSWTDWQDAEETPSFIIRLDTKNHVIEISNEKNTVIYLDESINVEKGIDEDGDKYVLVEYYAYDKDGNRCRFVSMDYPDLKNRSFLIKYSDMQVYFGCILITSSTKKLSI